MKRLFVAKYLIPLTASAALLIYLFLDDKLPKEVLVYVGLTYFAWLAAAWWAHEHRFRVTGNTIKSADFDQQEKKLLSSMSEVEKYYVRLLHGLNEAAEMVEYSLKSAQQTTQRMHDGVTRAHELAKNTGLLAANAMMSASACGEVGRGFVSVSKDLVKISERSEKDLVRLDSLLGSVSNLLSSVSFVEQHPGLHWIDQQLAGKETGGILIDLEELLIHLHGYQTTLGEISDNYETASQLDVRWLQLGEAIKRVINELNLSLLALTESSEKFAKEMRILQISDKLCETQLLEIKESLMKTEQLDKNFEEFAT
ncbi:MAG: hypothetical protein MI867_07190 [Pseudomonadales bacterium]|nr:hypothetical protein [Pseudomonadales bacterium]